MIRHPDSNLQIAEKIELALSSQNKRVNTEGTNIVTNEFNREDYVINKAQTEISLQSLAQGKQDVLTAGNGININNNNVISVDKVANAITFSDSGDGAASGSTFDGSAARKLSYNSIGAAAVSSVYGFTYVVDSDEKLTAWAENATGNDYTSVLIKKRTNPYTLSASSGINLTTTGTKCIVGEAGSKIIINKTTGGTGTGIVYDTLPTTNDYFIFNLTLEYNATSGRGIRYARNLINCKITTNGSSSSVAVTGFEDCYNICRCSAEGLSSGNYGYGFRDCINVRECIGYGEGSTIGTGFAHCRAVQNCNDTSDTKYYQSYFSPSINAAYACANTLEGGWNQ